jgi:hypothetical protein
MLSPLRNRFGIPGVISVIALVFAMMGGAYAATNTGGKATASAKAKKGPPGPRGKTGPAGPAGPAGAAGPTGAKGDKGDAGSNGSSGADGKSVTAASIAAGGECGGVAGVNYTLNGVTTKVCNGAKGANGAAGEDGTDGTNGADGSPWVVGTAPSGAVLKGTWAINPYTAAAEDELLFATISTGVPIPTTPLPPFAISAPNAEFGCLGTADEPLVEPTEAIPYVLCVYSAESVNLKSLNGASGKVKTSGGGVVVAIRTAAAGEAKAYGTWALKVP